MERVKSGLGGRGTAMTMDSNMPHPASHYEVKEMRVKKAKSGGFTVTHEMGLKKRHEAKPGFETGYDSRHPESETHVVPDMKGMIAHMQKHFGAAGLEKPKPNTNDEDDEQEDETSPEDEEE